MISCQTSSGFFPSKNFVSHSERLRDASQGIMEQSAVLSSLQTRHVCAAKVRTGPWHGHRDLCRTHLRGLAREAQISGPRSPRLLNQKARVGPRIHAAPKVPGDDNAAGLGTPLQERPARATLCRRPGFIPTVSGSV